MYRINNIFGHNSIINTNQMIFGRVKNTTRTFVVPVRDCNTTSTRGNNSQKILSAIADLEKFDIRLKNFPTMVLFGPQSSGKSSVIHALTGGYILPTGMKMATKKPTVITTLRSENVKYKIGDREFYQAHEAANEIDRLNRNDHVQKIDVIVHSPHVHNSVFIDLPGLFSISDDLDDHFKKHVKSLASAYVGNSNFIPIIIHASTSDPATNSAIKLVTKTNRRGESFGILTKIDMIKRQKTEYLEKMLNDSEYKLGHGYCAVMLSNDLDIERGISVDDKIKIEEEYLKKIPQIKPAGVPTLRKMISDIQARKIVEHIPDILRDVDIQIESLKNSQNFLNNLMNGSNKNLSKNLRILIEKLVGSSQDRADFENELRKRIKQEIKSHLQTAPIENSKLEQSTNDIQDGIIDFHYTRKSKYDVSENKFKELFSHGVGSPIFIDNSKLDETYYNEMVLGTSLPLIQPTIDDNLGTKRKEWNKQLNTYFSKLLKDDTIHKIIKDTTLKLLLEYIYDDPECSDPMSRKFAEYMVNEIGNEAFESKIRYSITAMLNLEKRPNVSIFELLRYFVSTHPEIFKIPDSILFTPQIKKYKLDVYGKEWIHAYSSVVIDNLAENCYRNVAVNLLDKMVEKLLEMTMDMFHKENALKEQNKVNEKINRN